MPEIGLFDAMYSARALRPLKPDPVPQEIITRGLDAAVRAPSAGHAQNWAFVVVRDAEQRRRLGMIYRVCGSVGRCLADVIDRSVPTYEGYRTAVQLRGTCDAQG
jgi:nitroreductase